jgi:transcription antitermination factor NusG
MPILALEPQLYPSDLFAAKGANRSEKRVWSVLHTRPRQEKSLARTMHAAQIPYYLPLLPHSVRVRNRMMTSYIPLFPSYLFLFAEPEERIAALATTRVVNSIRVADQEKLLRDLGQINGLLGAGLPVRAEDRLAPGVKVEIQSGPLAGLKGKIVHETSRQRFVVEVDFIQRGASVVLDGTTLAPMKV